MSSVYHYTDINALINIVRSKKLWLGHINTMNDSSEKKLLSNVLLDIADKDHPIRKYLSNKNGHFDGLFSIFCTSFSNKRDLLSQWRGYASDGTGACLVFDKDKLAKSFQHFSTSLLERAVCVNQAASYDCIYQKEKQHEYAQSLLAGWSENRILETMTNMARLKSDYFHEEREFRLVFNAISMNVSFTDGGKIKIDSKGNLRTVKFKDVPIAYRSANNRVIPYLEFEFAKEALTGIMLGPRCPMQVDDFALRLLLAHSDMHHLTNKIFRSEATYV